jgi:hypothetical protein
MTHINSSNGSTVLVRATDAELVGLAPQTVRLLANSSSTGGRLSRDSSRTPSSAVPMPDAAGDPARRRRWRQSPPRLVG